MQGQTDCEMQMKLKKSKTYFEFSLVQVRICILLCCCQGNGDLKWEEEIRLESSTHFTKGLWAYDPNLTKIYVDGFVQNAVS